MRIPAIIFILTATAALAPAQQRMTVAQLETVVSSRQPEDRIAEQISGSELTERLSPATLARLESHLKGQRCRQALVAIAGFAAFNDLPGNELPADPPPDATTQTLIYSRAAEYVRNLRPRLPNFSALRTTTLFEITPRAQMVAEERILQFRQLTSARLNYRSLGPAGAPGNELFFVGIADTIVTYRDGSELQSAPPAGRRHPILAPGVLASSGEFGSILSIVDHDAVNGKVAWHHWERGPSGLLAVYRFAVSREQSHFVILSSNPLLAALPPFQDHPAYHAELAVDPDSGSVYRITLLADPDPSDSALRSGIAVEYGPVEIGAKTYICPLHSIALSVLRDPSVPHDPSTAPPLRTLLNDVAFSNYHLFRSEYRILP